MQEGDVAAILRDLIEFLECLGKEDLSEPLQLARESLLARSRAAAGFVQLTSGTADSPEPYLDMNASCKNFLRFSGDETDQAQQDYVNAEVQSTSQQRGSLQHYYETFQDFSGPSNVIENPKDDPKTDADKGMENLAYLYAGFTAAQAKDKAIKSGGLTHLKRERKMFAPFNIFWLDRSCWVSLVGSHLLLYANDRESRPYLVLPLRGYNSRPAPNALARDPKRSEAAFEIYCPGDRTFQFVAKTPQEMKEWVEVVCQSLEPEIEIGNKPRAPTFVEILELESNERMCIEKVKEEKEKYQDNLINASKTKPAVVKTPKPEKEKVEPPRSPKVEELVPPLPARSRRLPSLPSQENLSYEPREELYEEDGIYHRIEDVKSNGQYQNLRFASVPTTRDNAAAATIDLLQQTYDDVANSRETSLEPLTEPGSITYDNISNVTDKSPEKEQKSPKSSKPSLKRSFLDRVRIRKTDSPKKEDKKSSSSSASTVSPPAPVEQPALPEIPNYDDVSNSPSHEGLVISEEEYLCPPPPRPIYSRPPTIIKCASPGDDIYDDIGSCLELNGCRGCSSVDVIQNYPKNGSFLSDLQLSIEQGEHYQVPKSNNRVMVQVPPASGDNPEDELYDDIAIFENFKSRPRDSVSSNSDKSIWSRIGSGRRMFENNRGSESSETTNESTSGDLSTTTFKPIHKLISTLESTLNKSTKVNGIAQN